MTEFHRAAAGADVPEDGTLAVEVDGVEIALVNSGGEIYAVYDECTHEQIPLTEGMVEDGEIECWLHGSMFDLRTGKQPAYRPPNP